MLITGIILGGAAMFICGWIIGPHIGSWFFGDVG